jgi:dipeptidyl aminopeptidase/acylaminoacyl peptidase
MVLDRATGEMREITKGFDLSVETFQWLPDSQGLMFNVEEAGYYRLYTASLSGAIEAVSDQVNAYDFVLDPKGAFVVYRGGSFTKPTELYAFDLKSRTVRQITDLNGEKIENLDLGGYEEFRFEGAKNVKVHGFLVKPPAFDPAKKYPLLLIVHGGPQQMSTSNFGYGWCTQLFASPGYVVALINPRGSRGYGQKFTDDITEDWGGKVYEDLMKGVDYLVATYPFIDGKRLAAAGGSYGGYMMNWFEGQTDRFRCLINHCGAYNLTAKYGSTDELWFPEWDIGGTYWTNREGYRQWSPSTYAAKFKTPMLIIHGQTDYRVPVEEAMQTFTTLQRQGIPSKFLYFPDEGHWILKPQNQELWYRTFHEWLAKWLKE